MPSARPTLRDVALAAGVDVSTVSRVLRQTKDAATSAETSARIRDAADSLGYRPNLLARTLKTARSNSIGIVVPYLDHPMNQQLIAAVEDVARPLGQSVIIYHVDEGHKPVHTLQDLASYSQVDGMIIAARVIMEGELGPLQSLGCPYILINETAGAADAVAFDNRAATHLATDHLVGLGHRRIALFPGPLGRFNAERRREGFLAATERAGLRPQDAFVVGSPHGYREAADAMAVFLASERGASAIIAATIPIALGVNAALVDAGLSVPKDLSLIVMHDGTLAEIARPSLTSIRFPIADLGRIAVEQLLRKIGGQPANLPQRLPPLGLVERQSTGPVPSRHPD